MIIDAYCHILPNKYQDALDKKLTDRDRTVNTGRYAESVPTLVDLDVRFRMMDGFPGYCQVLSVAAPAVYDIAGPELAVDLARMANDELAELIYKYPDRFVGGVATLPMNSLDEAFKEAERAVLDLRLRGVELATDINGKPLDSPEFFPLYEMMERFNLPVFLHPMRASTIPDYPGESESKYRAWTKLGWPYATALAMTRLVYGGVMEKYPKLKIVTHHCGGLIPFLAGRLTWNDDFNEQRMGHRDIFLPKRCLDYYRQMYYDTAVNGYTAALECGFDFAGEDKMIFATDLPFGNQIGKRLIRDTIESVERMDITPEQKKKIFSANVIEMMRLPLGVL